MGIWRLTTRAASGVRMREWKREGDRSMTDSRLTRRQVRMSAAAAAVVACTPGATSSPSPSASGAQRAVAPFKFLFGFTVQANPSLPVIIAKELGYYTQEDINISWDFTTDSTSIRLIGT